MEAAFASAHMGMKTLLITLNFEKINLGNVLCESKWPKYDESKLVDENVTIAIQVNGKLRGTIIVPLDEEEDTIKKLATTNENVMKHLEGKEIVKIIVIKNKIVNIVVR